MLYTTPNTWVDDITVVTHVAQDCNHASVDWQVVANGDVSVELRDADQQVVATGQGTSGTLQVVNPHLWQPGEGYLYELCVTAKARQSVISTASRRHPVSGSEGRTVPD